jgi:hypothetical protein
MKRNILFTLAVIFTLIMSGCGKVDMDRQAKDGNYHYENADLGFSVVLPPEFIYYQTQRQTFIGYTDLQIFVPTSDPNFVNRQPSAYAMPITVRVYEEATYDAIQDADEKAEYALVGRKNGKAVTIKFWSSFPQDWEGKWTDEMREMIVEGVEMI